MADFRAWSSLAKAASPADAHMPRSRWVLVLIAAGIAEIGVLGVAPCTMV